MAQTKKELEIRLVSVNMDSASGLAKKTNNMLVCRMPWLRTGIELRDGSQKLKLTSGHWNGNGRPWSERILLKETVQGTFSIVMALSKPITDAAFAKFVGNSAYYIVKALAALADKAAPTSAFGDIASGPLESLAKNVTDTSAVTDAFVGSVDLSSDQLPASGKTISLEIPLLAESDIVSNTEKSAKGSTRTVHKTLLNAGERAGSCVIEITVM